MKIVTKYDLRQMVYPITKKNNYIRKKCQLCEGSGMVLISGDVGREIMCPDCYGEGFRDECEPAKYTVSLEDSSKIGRIDVERYFGKRSKDNRTRYMLDATGIGSGALWPEERIFSTIEEAQAECDRLNEIGE